VTTLVNTINAADIEGDLQTRRSGNFRVGRNADRSCNGKTAAAEQTFAGDGKICSPILNVQFRGQNSVTDWM